MDRLYFVSRYTDIIRNDHEPGRRRFSVTCQSRARRMRSFLKACANMKGYWHCVVTIHGDVVVGMIDALGYSDNKFFAEIEVGCALYKAGHYLEDIVRWERALDEDRMVAGPYFDWLSERELWPERASQLLIERTS